MANKVSRPVVYGGVLVLAIAGLIMANSPPSSSQASTAAKKARAANGVVAQFDDHDYKDRFPRLNEGARNAFNPLVVRKEGANGGALAPNEIPASYTGGEAGWLYTGTVIVDEVPSALVENEVTGDFLYLKVGEKLKRAVIAQIAPTYIVVNGAAGQILRLDLLIDAPEPGQGIDAMGIQPFRPDVPAALSGPIGGPMAQGAQNQRTNAQ